MSPTQDLFRLNDKVSVVTGGAKGIGELPMDGGAPAILNAIEHATGVSFNHVPLMPEMLMEQSNSSSQKSSKGTNEWG